MAEVVGEDYALSVAPEQEEASDDPESIFGSLLIFNQIKKEMAESKLDTFFLVHGYAVSFKNAILGAARMREAYAAAGKDMNILLFSWPSDGRNLPQDYGNDRLDAEHSGPALARGILKGIAFLQSILPGEGCGQDCYLGLHSMGNYAGRFMVREIKRFHDPMPRIFKNIFSFAADEDDDAMEDPAKLYDLPQLGRKLHIYFNHSDKALEISNLTKGNPDRLGHVGPRNPQTTQNKVTLVDVSRSIGWDLIGHSYFMTDKYVIDDVVSVLNGTDDAAIPNRQWQPDRHCFKLCP